MTEAAAAREAVYMRCRGRCERCGRGLPGGIFGAWEAHHRKRKSQGGSWALSNVIALHARCHNQHRDSVHDQPARSYDFGWLVRSGADPARVPVLIMGWQSTGQWALLTDDGRYELTAAPTLTSAASAGQAC